MKKNNSQLNQNLNAFEILTLKGETVCVIANKGETSFEVDGKKYILKTVELAPDCQPLPEKLTKFLKDEITEKESEKLKNEFFQKDFSFYVLSIIPTQKEKTQDIVSYLNAVSKDEDLTLDLDCGTIVYLKKYSPDDDYTSATEFAKVLFDNIKEELKSEFKINVGGKIKKFSEFKETYQRSLFAHKFGQLLNSNENIYPYNEYAVTKMLSEIPKDILFNHLTTLIDRKNLKILSDIESMETADTFLKNSLNISETARDMFLHRNTLIYRLDKIETSTGLNIRSFNDAVTFRLISILHKLSNE
ncbi:MAG: helix-turn-helix domain-containing protein [Firmicutes bacterium]|nr:helix-turn-helix domain-containing protein [Bacillota bacterium]